MKLLTLKIFGYDNGKNFWIIVLSSVLDMCAKVKNFYKYSMNYIPFACPSAKNKTTTKVSR